jgi:hypothetical protein
MGPLDKFVLNDRSLGFDPSGFTLSFRSHWYRSLPLSCIGLLSVAIDDVEVPSDQMSLQLENKRYPIAELPVLFNEWWFILDSPLLRVNHSPALRFGQRYRVDFKLGLYIPYLLVGPNADPVLTTSRTSKELVCEGQ